LFPLFADPSGSRWIQGDKIMLRWAIAFFIIAIIAGALGFYGLANTSADIAKFLALVFIVLFVIALIVGRSVVGGPTV
jgi:uncharacterized membrane protein YtjA (UPF0391 family)